MSTYSTIKSVFLSSLILTTLAVSSAVSTVTDKNSVPNECEWGCQGWWLPDFDKIFSRSISVNPAIHYQSSMSFKENSQSYTINVLLPDIEKKNISINIINDLLVIAAERKVVEKTKEKTQQSYSSYHQSLVLPENADIDKIEATFKKDSVMITIPKTANKTAKKILIH
ncbi:MAG: Hsp20/alpha crystallin family protein [Campylobacterales bacterium]|nr:Hsp20/alpha crystallin family protein [Campylobacterales bacterium]